MISGGDPATATIIASVIGGGALVGSEVLSEKSKKKEREAEAKRAMAPPISDFGRQLTNEQASTDPHFTLRNSKRPTIFGTR